MPMSFPAASKGRQFRGKINSGPWVVDTGGEVLVYPAKYVLCKSYHPKRFMEQGTYFWDITAVFQINEERPWNPVRVLNAGSYEKVSGELKPIKSKGTGEALQTVPLKANGERLPVGDPVTWEEFTGYKEEDFAGLFA